MYVSQSYWGRNEAGRSDIATMKKGMTQCPTEGEQKCLNTFHLRELHPGSKVEQIRFLVVSFCWWTIFIFIFASSFQWKCRTLAWLNNWAKNLITSPFFCSAYHLYAHSNCGLFQDPEVIFYSLVRSDFYFKILLLYLISCVCLASVFFPLKCKNWRGSHDSKHRFHIIHHERII